MQKPVSKRSVLLQLNQDVLDGHHAAHAVEEVVHVKLFKDDAFSLSPFPQKNVDRLLVSSLDLAHNDVPNKGLALAGTAESRNLVNHHLDVWTGVEGAF